MSAPAVIRRLAIALALAGSLCGFILFAGGPGGGGGGGTQTIAGISLTDDTVFAPQLVYVASQPSGQKVANVNVAMSPFLPAFTGSLSLSTAVGACTPSNGANNANWKIVGGVLYTNVANLSGSQAICIAAAQTGLTSIGVAFTLTSNVNGFFIATNGADTNPGTLASPFQSFAKCQAAMQGSGGVTLTCYVRGGPYGSAALPASLTLGAADAGETWSYYPPDGYDTALISGGTVGAGTGLLRFAQLHAGASNVTFNGLVWHHFQHEPLFSFDDQSPAVGISGLTIINNQAHDIINTGSCCSAGLAYIVNPLNVTIKHNAFWNIASQGVRVLTSSTPGNQANGSMNGADIEYNVAYSTCQNDGDCGCYYLQDIPQLTTVAPIVKYNICRDPAPAGSTGPGGGPAGNGIYLDDCVQSTGVQFNVIFGHVGVGVLVHGGNSTNAQYNIVDFGQYQNQAAGPGLNVDYFLSGHCATTLAGSLAQQNLFLANLNGGGGNYKCDVSTTTGAIIDRNGLYFAPSGTAPGSGTTGQAHCPAAGSLTDATPTSGDPKLSGCYVPAAGSPLFSAPLSWPALPAAWGTAGFWGPPGYVIPQTEASASLPSYTAPSC